MKIFAVLISILFVVLAALHVLVESITIDAIAIVLFVLAALPWLFPYLKSLELPGGVKIEMNDVTAAIKKVSEGSEVSTFPETDEYEYLRSIAVHDPNLALVAVRIEIEKGVRKALNEERVPLSLTSGIRRLTETGVLSNSVANGLKDFIRLGNHAAHGVEVETQAAEYVIDNAGSILKPFKEQLANAS